ncbi:MAG: peptidylprolyl isomerase [Ekhidna sp.]|uniref:peptidylprolyl isomerase n=1 Tax=Ekhidna sp. TaxID=2608089 RepID=UPI0032ED46E6
MKTYLPLLLLISVISCTSPKEKQEEATQPVQVELVTSKGTIVLELSDRTPKHRDNFIQLVKENAYDSLLFHRVIEGFMVQAGDPESKYAHDSAALGDGDRDYKIPAEFDTTLFHKRGALGAARDGNSERASSAMQFYIVQRGALTDSLIDRGESRINGWLAENYVLNAPENELLKNEMEKAMENQEWETYSQLNDSLKSLAKSFEFDHYTIPEEHREVYRSLGGTPHLDQNYTVFGEVISGMEVVDSIAAVQVNELDRPVENVRIISARIIEQ